MRRILVLNNYPLETVWNEVQRKEKPDHHLFGINYFQQQGYEVKILPFQNLQFLKTINKIFTKSRFPVPVGDLNQQWSALRCLNKADLIYTPCQTQSYILSYLRALGLVKKPIVCLAHHPLNIGRLAWFREPFLKLLLKGTDAFPSLSKEVANTINQLANTSQKSCALGWGPDADFYPSTSSRGRGVVAAGRTGRDFDTFGIAASQTSTQVHIICLENSVTQLFPTFRNNIRVSIQPEEGYMKYPELIENYANARVLAIPLLPGRILSGLTSLMDALGMGKPVIMTRHPLIDLDIEAAGIGIWVDSGDVQAWRNAIQFFEDHEDEAIKMGKRARNLVEQGINSVSFADQAMKIFEKVLANSI